MCAITGFMTVRRSGRGLPSSDVLERMTDRLAHRGPDSRGIWYDEQRGIGLGHRRLAIRDLSPLGAQPMTSSCGRFVIVYNGEVYSHRELAQDLAGTSRRIKGVSDTEIILEACAEWGIDRVLPRMIGMFAFALYDKQSRELVLVRDRLGIKPLYWSLTDGLLMFASELKALRDVPGWKPRIDRNALAAFMRHNYIPAPHSIYRGVHKLEPGSLLKVGHETDAIAKTERFWDLRTVVERAVSIRDAEPKSNGVATDKARLSELDALLGDAVHRRMVSDVPLGTLLSGGIDSSLVTALMAEQSSRPVKTFSIGFAEKGFDEAPFARDVAAHLKTDHTELYVEPGHALDLVEKLPYWYDEPFSDSSQLPTALVCELTRQHVTVVLSGDGGDELFAGYDRYYMGLDLWRKATRVPQVARNLMARGVLSQSQDRLDALCRILPKRFRRDRMGDKLHKFSNAILANAPDDMYRRMLSHWDEPEKIIIGAKEAKGILWDDSVRQSLPDFLDRMQFLDTATYLPDDILTKVDRASMAFGLEVRVPLLDHRVVEHAWSLPQSMKFRDGQSKWALRQLLYSRVPRHLIDRPKMGFGVPIAEWLRGPLRDWAEALLDEERLADQGLFVPGPIRQRWQAHQDGHDWAYLLWDVLMVQAWIDANDGVTL